MNDKLSISIQNPCSENFRNFKPTQTGGYCGACKKTVVDFTKMNDREIQDYFNSVENISCGVFLESQLKTYPMVNPLAAKPKSSRFVSGVFGVSLLSLLSFNSGHAQDKKANETIKVETGKENQTTDSLTQTKTFIVTGSVSDSAGPLPGAVLVLKGTTIGVQADVDGKFVFPQPLKAGDVLVASFIGFEDVQVTISEKNGDKENYHYDIRLKDSTVIMMGEVATNRLHRSKKTFFQKIKSLFTNE